MTTPVRVLFIEDSEDDVSLLADYLRIGGYQLAYERIESADALRSALHRGGWDLVISDYNMPRFSGLEALSIVMNIEPELPFILVSGNVSESEAVESINCGAADYLMKNNLIRFVPAVTRALRDAAERKASKRAETFLRSQRSLLSMIFDNTSDALFLFTHESRIDDWTLVTANRSAARMIETIGLRYVDSDWVGQHIEPLVGKIFRANDAQRNEVLDSFSHSTESGRPLTQEYDIRSPRGVFWWEINFVPFIGPDGISRHLLLAVRDVTSRRKSEDDRRHFEAQMAQSKKMEALGRLAGGVAHDFNNILTGIMGFADMVTYQTEDPLVQVYTGEIVQASNRAKDMIKQILMFSRKLQSERKPIRLGGVINEVSRLIAQQPAVGNRIAIEVDIEKKEPAILGDHSQFHQVLLNLGTNAAQAMEASGGTLTFRLRKEHVGPDFCEKHPTLKPGLHLYLCVSDTGTGIPSKVLEKLFEPFFTTKSQGRGTGLGLSVVLGVIQNHEGIILVQSKEGKGTTFEIYIPAVEETAFEPSRNTQRLNMSNEKRRILFMDDEEPILRLVTLMFKSMGHEATMCKDGAEGWQTFAENPNAFDIVISDYHMPKMEGTEVAQKIRERRADIPIVISSGLADDALSGLEGVDNVHLFQKPFTMQALSQMIENVTRPE